jgi:dihydrofolate synthase / folylpolyglutamate synthase
MRFASLTAWLGWLEQSHPKEIDLGLDRIRRVAERLDLLNLSAKVVTVAGTNGKGSCVTATAGLLRAAGLSVGVYTSPHLLRYNERIQLNGQLVSDELICTAFEQIADAANGISLTYFEYGTLAALLIFKQQAVDAMVLEVGLGGRLDAINIIDADVGVITSIALDHQDWLGDNREDIGREKAGILRAGQYFVCADEQPPASIVDIAQKLDTRSHYIGREFSYQLEGNRWHWQGSDKQGHAVALNNMVQPRLPLPSMAAALQVVQWFGLQLNAVQVEQTLLNLVLPGRFQKLVFQGRELVLDVAHNPAATQYLAGRLEADPVPGRTLAIVAMMADKDRRASLENLVDAVDEWNLLDLSPMPRAATPAMLAGDLAEVGAMAGECGSADYLLKRLLARSGQDDRILVFGSFFTVAAVLALVQAD